ncbi:response regulator transcription factor [Fictibacillus sp. 23RED33]|uniref:response regulator transcription factor n=1 Tax=Fictibacillus sp. 23RED33 TaxID=2745879 RepID=UPI001E65CEDC|nr:response regulator transcription factor [Fictibacillus sp. 23RED33]
MKSIFLVNALPVIRNEMHMLVKTNFPSLKFSSYTTLNECSTHSFNKQDILIVYMESPIESVLKILKSLQKKGVKIVIWIGSNNEKEIQSFLLKKFIGYFNKEIGHSEIVVGLNHIAANKPYLHPQLSTYLFTLYLLENRELKQAKDSSLSAREWEVLQYLAKGLNNKKISDQLFLTESTVKNHVSAILRKLDVPDRTSAVLIAIKNRWVQT